ncbi:unnamed protein product [Gadus morhua 'NCC']
MVENSKIEIKPPIYRHREIPLSAKQWMLALEGKVFITPTNLQMDFTSALAVLFGSYYAFNIEYQPEAASTLDFIQRFLVRINPEFSKCTPKFQMSKKMNKMVQREQSVTATGGGPSTPELTPIDTKVASIIGTASVSGIVSEREGDTDNTEEQESAVGGEEDDDAGEGPSAAGHPAAPTPSTTRQSAGRVLTDAVLQLQREMQSTT